MAAPALLARLLAAAFFAVAVASFALPMTLVSTQARTGAATGVELARGKPELAGTYAPREDAGAVERRLRRARVPAAVALAAAAAGMVLALFVPRAAVAAGLVGLVALGGVLVATASPVAGVATDRRYGFWYAGLALAAATACSAASGRRPGRPRRPG